MADDGDRKPLHIDLDDVRERIQREVISPPTSGLWLSLGQLTKLEEGETTEEALLTGRLREAGGGSPTPAQLAEFTANVAGLREEQKKIGQRLRSTFDLAERVNATLEPFKIPDLAVSTKMPPFPVPGARTAEAVERLRNDMVTILEQMVTNANDSGRRQIALSRKTLFVAFATLVVSIIAVVIALA